MLAKFADNNPKLKDQYLRQFMQTEKFTRI